MQTFDELSAIVADDHELFRAALAEFLRRELGFRHVTEVGSLAEVVDHLDANADVALACIDLSMPGMTGSPSLQQLRDAHPDLRLVVITGSERRDDILLALAAGVHGYIPKTFRLAELAGALRTVMEGRIFVPPALANKIFQPSARDEVAGPAAGPAAQKQPDLHGLSPRQRDVLSLIMAGKSNKEIARSLCLAEGTVKVHVHALFRALGAHNRMGAVALMARFNEKSAFVSMAR